MRTRNCPGRGAMSAGTQQRLSERRKRRYEALDPDTRLRAVVDLLATGIARAVTPPNLTFREDSRHPSNDSAAPVGHPDCRGHSLNSTDVEPSVTSLASPPVNEDLSSDAGEERATRGVAHG